MSADNGWIMRRDQRDKIVLQEYGASADSFPPINDMGIHVFDTVDEALVWYQEVNPWSEYGLTIQTAVTTFDPVPERYSPCNRHYKHVFGDKCHSCECVKMWTAAQRANIRTSNAFV